MVGLPDGEKNFEDMYNRLDRIPACDGQIDIVPRHSPRYAYASRGKNIKAINQQITAGRRVLSVPVAAVLLSLEPRHVGFSSTRTVPPRVVVFIPTDVVDDISPVQQRTQPAPVAYVNGRPFRFITPTKISIVQRVVGSQQIQVVRQLARASEVVDVDERMRRCYGFVVSLPCAHHDRNYFVSETVTEHCNHRSAGP